MAGTLRDPSNVHETLEESRIICDIAKPCIKTFQEETQQSKDCKKLCEYIDESCIGKDLDLIGPFGKRKVVYCDHIASGKSLKFIENYITKNVLPCYANVHSPASYTSSQTRFYREEARTIIRNAVNASEHDAVIFCGSGTTAAVNKLVHALKLTKPPILFIGPFEHHSNLLPWKEINSKIVWIQEKSDGNVDIEHLEEMLKLHSVDEDRELIGCFSAASNITGILSDTNKVSACLHRHGAMAFWDYATAGAYTEINMNPIVTSENQSLVYKDAIFLSCHKFIGGVGTPGVLVAKKSLFRNNSPSISGGSTVFFVTHNTHRYFKEIEMREEGGTPAIVECIRAGLVFQLKEAVGHENIMKKEREFQKLASDVFSRSENLIVLGNMKTSRLSVFSFVIRHKESGLFLHHNFVSTLLNDLFGIQSRSGCSCAGPYAQDLLGIDEKLAMEIRSVILEDSRLDRVQLRRHQEFSERELIRPGFSRINLPYFMKKEEALFILESIVLIAKHGWKLLPQYMFNIDTGEWHHNQHQTSKHRKWLGSISYSSGEMQYPDDEISNEKIPPNFQECLNAAFRVFTEAAVLKGKNKPSDQSLYLGEAEKLRWFLLPSEAHMFLRGEIRDGYPKVPPFTPLLRCFSGKSLKEKKEIMKLDSETSHVRLENPPSCCKKIIERSTNECQQQITKNTHEVSSIGKSDKNNAKNVIKRKEFDALRFYNPPRRIFNLTVKAIEEFKMIENGDKVLVCVSGGKDSLSMLHTLYQYQYYAKMKKDVNFSIGAATVDPGSSGYDPSPLKDYMRELGVEYFYEMQGIMKQASELSVCESICSFCSRMKRGRLYACARRNGYNVLAIGQHLDDIAESFLMSVFHNGVLRTMKANYHVSEDDLRVIRPMTYVREKDLRDFAETCKLPVIAENCPACFEAPKERHRVKQLLAGQEILFPQLFKSIQSALKPLMARKRTQSENKHTSFEGTSLLRK